MHADSGIKSSSQWKPRWPSSYDWYMATRGGVTGAARAPRGRNGSSHDVKMTSAARAATLDRPAPERGRSSLESRSACCSLYHRAIELVGKRWSGAILLVVLDGPLNF